MKRNFTRILAAFALLVGLTIPMGMWGQTSSTVTIQYTGSTTTNMTGNNDAALVGLSSTDWSVVGAKGASQNFPGLNKAGDIRLYYDENGSNTITVTNLQNNTISSIVITYTGQNYSNGKVLVNDNEVEVSDGSYAINATSFVVTNGNTSNIQVRISSIVVTYTGGNTPQPDTYLITYKAGEGTGSDVTETKTEGVDYTILGQPEGFSAPTGKVFDGWLGDDNNSYVPGDTYSTDAALTLTAQWTENTTPGGDEQWVLTNLADLTTNDVFVIVGNNGSNFAMSNDKGTGSAPSAVAVTVSGNEITSTVAANIQWTIGGNATDGYTFYPNGSTTTWLYATNTNNGVRVGDNTNKTFEIRDAYLYHQGTSRYIGIYNSSDWRCYTTINSNIQNQTFAFYKKVTGGIVPPSISAENVDIAYNATSGSIDYTINNEPDPVGTLTAAIKDGTTPTIADFSLGTVTSEVVPFTCSANNTGTARTATVTLTYTYNREAVTKDVTVTQAGNPNAVMTIAEVRAQGTGSVATKGVVTSITGSNNKTAYIQDASAAVVVYGDFTAAVGDEIRVSGTLTTYHGLLEITDPQITVLSNGNTVSPTPKTIAEINADDYTLPTSIQGLYVTIEEATVTAINGQNTTIAQGENTIVVRGIYSNVSYNVNDVLTLDGNIGCYDAAQIANPQNVQVQAAPSITFDPDVVDLEAEMQTIQISFTYDNIVVTNYESFAVHHYDEEGEEIQNTPETPWYIPGVTGSNDEGYNLTVFVSANEGEARSAYMKVSALDAGGTTVYSNLVTVNQAAYVAPFEPTTYTLATSIESGKTYIITDGLDRAMGVQNGTVRSAADVTIDESTATVNTADVYEFVISGNETDGYTIFDSKASGYLYASSSSSNNIGTRAENSDANSMWAIESGDENGVTITAKGDKTRNSLRYNYNQGNDRFSCYGSNSSLNATLYLFVKEETPTNPTITVNGYGETNGGYVLLAWPESTSPTAINGMISDNLGAQVTPETPGTYDLYSYDESQEMEWRNYRTNNFGLVPGKGYLYASKAGVTLTYEGEANPVFADVNLPYTENKIVKSIYLAGNSQTNEQTFYVYNGELAKQSFNYLTMNEDGNGYISAQATSYTAPAMTGFFVQAPGANMTLSTTDVNAKANVSLLNINVLRNRGSVIDNAIVSFSNGSMMDKFYLMNNTTRVYIPQGNREMAIANSAAQGEMPVSFRASENGTYTIAVEAENVDMNYLHLIDNMTGADVDLLATPNYTFEARTNDYTSRFRLVFSANGIDEQNAETFAFFNGTSWTVSNTGDATLQVVDITGRIVSSETINGNATISLNQPAGIYMLRLVNGNDVKVQKVVVR